ncbi:MAG: single-stranded-DNA-specific exonuclease RecJ [Candidatus Flexifilum sp.]
MTQAYNWSIAPPAPRDFLHRIPGIPPVIAQILYNRGLVDPRQAQAFLRADALEPGQFLNIKRRGGSSIDRAIARIKRAIDRGESIVVYGDFDADGVTSTALLTQTLEALGANVRPYIPHRIDEGYGLNSDALLRLRREGASLIVTVDCGIRSIEEVNDGQAYGLDLIVTDHHSLGPEIPPAHAVITPTLDDCASPEPRLAGVGVAVRLAEARLAVIGPRRRAGGPLPTPDDLLDLVAIGTVADLAPLNRSENRALVKRGLAALNRAQRPGIRALLTLSGLRPGEIDAQAIGFALGPRINAAGRLDSAMLAYHLLTTTDEAEAAHLALRLQELNQRRQELTRAAHDEIVSQIDPADDQPLIFASGQYQPGIVGLVAGRLAEQFYRPAIVMETGETESRASCRSIPQFDITRALDQCADLLVRHGGHAQAAGLTIRNENIPFFREQLTEIARNGLAGQDLRPTLEIDAELSADAITLDLAQTLQELEPTGQEHPRPLFITRGLRVLEARPVGKEGQHLRLRLARPDAAPVNGIGFRLFNNGAASLRLGDRIDVVYALEVNHWNGETSAQLRIEDLRPHQPET